jgi:hypothetical protein
MKLLVKRSGVMTRKKLHGRAFVVCSAIVSTTARAAQDYIGLYGGDAKLLTDSLEYVQRTQVKFSTLSARTEHPRHPPDGGQSSLTKCASMSPYLSPPVDLNIEIGLLCYRPRLGDSM